MFISENKNGAKFELDITTLFNEINRIKILADEFINKKSPYDYLLMSK